MTRPPVVPLSLLAAALLLAPRAAPQDGFLYSLNERGKLSIDGTVLETLPGKFNPNDDEEPTGQHRWTGFGVQGPDRYALRLDGLMRLNGAKYATLPFTLLTDNTPFWIALDVGPDGVFALRTDGLIARDGTADATSSPSGTTFFFDLAGVGDEVFTLRFDGAVFLDGSATPVFQLRGEPPQPEDPDDPDSPLLPPVPNDGSSPLKLWVRLVRDPVSDTLLALRADGVVFRLDPDDAVLPGAGAGGGLAPEGDEELPGGDEVARFPVPQPVQSELYVDLEIDADGDFAVLRGHGEVYTPDDLEEPFVDYPPGNVSNSGEAFVDLAYADDVLWALRYNGAVFRHEQTEPWVTLVQKLYVALDVDDALPNLDMIDDTKPVTARYKARAVEGDDVSVPVLVSDVDEPTGAGISVTAEPLKKTPPGMTYDAESGRVVWPDAGPKGSYVIRLLVQDDDVAKPRKEKVVVKVLPADTDPAKNKPPQPSQVKRVQALVGHELVLPVLASDPDGDALVLAPLDDTKGAFALGAVFDDEANELRWTPVFEHVGKHKAILTVSDGVKTKKLKLRIDVVNPLPVDT